MSRDTRLNRAAPGLSPKQRGIIILCAYKGESVAAVAAAEEAGS